MFLVIFFIPLRCQVIPLECFEAHSAGGRFVPIVAGGSSMPLTFNNRRAYVDCAIQFRLHEMDLQVGCLCCWVTGGCKWITHTRLTALCPGLLGWAGTRVVKPIWILLKQETVSGSSISWAICKSAPRSRQITMPTTTTQFFTGRMPFLPPNQQLQSTESL